MFTFQHFTGIIVAKWEKQLRADISLNPYSNAPWLGDLFHLSGSQFSHLTRSLIPVEMRGANYDVQSPLLACCGCLVSSNYPLFSYNFNKNNAIILIILYTIVIPLVLCTMLILLNGKKNLDGNFAYSNVVYIWLHHWNWQFLLHIFLLSIKNTFNWN